MDNIKAKVLLHVIDSGSLTKAAAAFGYTPSGVSHMISSIEQEVGFSLLVRTKTGVAPTSNAERLVPIIRAQCGWDEQFQQTVSEINGLTCGTLNIAAYSSIASQWLPAVIGRFHRSYPDIRINLLEGVWQEVSNYLSERRVELGFYSYQPSIRHHWIPLRNDPMVVAVPVDHPLASRASVRLEELERETLIMPAYGLDVDVQNLFGNKKMDSQFTTLQNYSAFGLVEEGLGLVVTNELITKGLNVKMKILPFDPPRSIMLGIAVPAEAEMMPAAARFIECAKEVIRDGRI